MTVYYLAANMFFAIIGAENMNETKFSQQVNFNIINIEH